MKRTDYISWDDFFMGLALLAAQRSKDPNTQVGACIVDQNNRVISIGYNGFPNGCSDDDLSWDSHGDFLNIKYSYVVHSEQNAIINSNKKDLKDCRMYVTLFPCNECAKNIIQCGIKSIIYLNDKYHDRDFTIAARRMFDLTGVKYFQFKSQKKQILIDLE